VELEEEVGGALSVEDEESGPVSPLSSSPSLSSSVISPSSLPAGNVQSTIIIYCSIDTSLDYKMHT
jgi:hypothetical protein